MSLKYLVLGVGNTGCLWDSMTQNKTSYLSIPNVKLEPFNCSLAHNYLLRTEKPSSKMPFPPVPNEIKPIAHYMKVAEEHDSRNLVVSYWSKYSNQNLPLFTCCRFSRSNVRLPDSYEDRTRQEVARSISLPNQCHGLAGENEEREPRFGWHLGRSRRSGHHRRIRHPTVQFRRFTGPSRNLQQVSSSDNLNIKAKQLSCCRNTVKAFYTTGILLDVLQQFGDLSEDLQEKRKYAKYKAAYIHHCLKIGDEPISGPPVNDTYGDASDDEDTPKQAERPEPPQPPTAQQPQPQIPSPSIPSLPNVPTPAAREPQVHYVPSTDSSTESAPKALETGALLSQEQLEKAQKYCKWATSALNYDDVKTAADNLQKALKLLQTGQDS